MFKLMREHHKKFTSLNNLVPWTENHKELKQEVLTNAGHTCNELRYIYKNKYNKKNKYLRYKKWNKARIQKIKT